MLSRLYLQLCCLVLLGKVKFGAPNMADTNIWTVILCVFSRSNDILLVVTSFINTDRLLTTSNFILERNRMSELTDLGVYGLLTSVHKGAFSLVHLQQIYKFMKRHKSISLLKTPHWNCLSEILTVHFYHYVEISQRILGLSDMLAESAKSYIAMNVVNCLTVQVYRAGWPRAITTD